MKKYYLLSFFLFLSGTLFSQKSNVLKSHVENGTVQMATDDGQFSFGVGGRLLMDAAAYFDDKTDLGAGSEIRDIRFLMKATLWKKWEAKFNIGFSNGNVCLKDVFLLYRINGNSFVKAGHFLEPFGIEQTESSKTTKFMHLASTVEAFRPGRNLGVSYASWSEKVFWEAGLFGSDVNDDTAGDEGFGMTSRFVFSPIHTDKGIFHVGTSGIFRTADAAGFNELGQEKPKSIRYCSRAATHIEERRFIDAKIDDADKQIKVAFEMIAALGPVSMQGEFVNANVSRNVGKDYSAHGFYTQIGWLVKGGNCKYKMKSARLSKPKPGSVELMARYNQTDLNDSNALLLGGKQEDISLGGTWYANHNVLVKFQFTNVDLDENALNGEENFNMIQTRLQFSF
ncbi:OprO/OprP family phosphate-selective porin [Marinifilum sp.]|uniref:OprO/OprP family phosphate-selective porin n=1 Tax=Marinifilum sp. TaxID=2033137 RepID=UPI003BA8A33D